jgi:hypothetical protein
MRHVHLNWTARSGTTNRHTASCALFLQARCLGHEHCSALLLSLRAASRGVLCSQCACFVRVGTCSPAGHQDAKHSRRQSPSAGVFCKVLAGALPRCALAVHLSSAAALAHALALGLSFRAAGGGVICSQRTGLVRVRTCGVEAGAQTRVRRRGGLPVLLIIRQAMTPSMGVSKRKHMGSGPATACSPGLVGVRVGEGPQVATLPHCDNGAPVMLSSAMRRSLSWRLTMVRAVPHT